MRLELTRVGLLVELAYSFWRIQKYQALAERLNLLRLPNFLKDNFFKFLFNSTG